MIRSCSLHVALYDYLAWTRRARPKIRGGRRRHTASLNNYGSDHCVAESTGFHLPIRIGKFSTLRCHLMGNVYGGSPRGRVALYESFTDAGEALSRRIMVRTRLTPRKSNLNLIQGKATTDPMPLKSYWVLFPVNFSQISTRRPESVQRRLNARGELVGPCCSTERLRV